MSPDTIHSLLSNVWSIFLVVLFFGGSIFVHELGHFLAARKRGVLVTRFSIGFGPKICSWKGKDGVEYRLSWLPLGGYVALPQLADMRGIEGDSDIPASAAKPISYATKMIVFGAGAFFNIIFAFLLACVLYGIGQYQSSELATTRIGYISQMLELPDGTKVPSPASQADLQVGDVIRAVDGHSVKDWFDVQSSLILGAGVSKSGDREVTVSRERNGTTKDVVLQPVLSGDERVRRIGIAAGYELLVQEVAPGSLAEKAGFKAQDELVSFDGHILLNVVTYQEYLTANPQKSILARVKRGDQFLDLSLPPRASSKEAPHVGLTLTTGLRLVRISPFTQLADNCTSMVRNLVSLINPHSDIGISKFSGPVGIARIFHSAAEAGMRVVLMFTILVNVNLAIFNLLPVPVLDGGHMLFATISRLRGRSLPTNFVMTTQSVFVALIFSMILYLTFNDARRWTRDAKAENAPAEAAAPAPVPAPAKP